jgi:ABC-type sugar transport system ATPase subunit
VRAEHLSIAATGVPAVVQVVEPLGSHALITVLVGKTPVKIQTPVDSPVRPNEQVALTVDRARIRWMDDATGAAIDAPA